MSTTAHLGITLLSVSQSQKETSVNNGFTLIDAMLASGILVGPLGSRPAFGWQGRLYFANDAGAQALYFDTGSAWTLVQFDAGTAGSVNFSGGSAPTAVAGGQAGTSPPSPVVVAGSNGTRGTVTFGTGTSPAAGLMATVTFAVAYTATPLVLITPINNTLVDLHPTPGNLGATSFGLFVKTAPAASQGASTYQFSYLCLS